MPTVDGRCGGCAERWRENNAVEIQGPEGIENNSYAEMRHMAESIAAWLVARGIQPGTRVAILADNHPRWVAAYLGIIAAGGAAVPLDTAYHADQVAKLLRDSGSSLIVCDSKHLPVVQEAVAGSDIAVVLTASGLRSEGQPQAAKPAQAVADFDGIFADRPGNFHSVPRGPDDLASLLYTSGTTA